jgi:hypothetical protein
LVNSNTALDASGGGIDPSGFATSAAEEIERLKGQF